jgi:hypothetical protein
MGDAMSMELIVLSDRRLSSIADWQQAIDAEKLHLTLSTETPIDGLSGFLPVRSNDAAMTGFECYLDDAQEIFELYPDVKFGRSWSNSLTFRWGSDLDECLAACAAAAAYAKATGGVVFDPQDGRLMSWQETLAEIPIIRRESDKWKDLPRILAERIARDR